MTSNRKTMLKKYLIRVGLVLLAVLTFSACDKKDEPSTDNTRDAFIGDYSFVSTGNIDLYAGAVKMVTVPLDQKGELSITAGNEPNTVWVIAAGDSTVAYVSENQLFMDPTTEEAVYGNLVMQLSFTYGRATLENDRLSWTSDVEIKATYGAYNLFGNGQVDIVATKKTE